MPNDSTLSLPELTFEAFWQTFEDHYAFFKLRKINWGSTYTHFRGKVNSNTSDEELLTSV